MPMPSAAFAEPSASAPSPWTMVAIIFSGMSAGIPVLAAYHMFRAPKAAPATTPPPAPRRARRAKGTEVAVEVASAVVVGAVVVGEVMGTPWGRTRSRMFDVLGELVSRCACFHRSRGIRPGRVGGRLCRVRAM